MVAEAPADEFTFFLDATTAHGFDLSGPNVRVVCVAQRVAPTQAAAANGNRSPADMLRMSRAVWRDRPDVFFSPSVYTYFPLPPALAAVVTILDAIPERFPELTLPSRRDRLFWRLKVSLALRQARLILTISEFASREIADALGVAPSRIRVASVAPAAVYRPSDSSTDIATAAGRLGLPRGARWFVYVGGFNPHKRVDTIVRAHATLVADGGADGELPHLLLVGAATDSFYGNEARIRAAIAHAGTDRLVHWTGFVPDAELRHLLSGAIALLLPSENEGFGLTAVEAAACGTPVVATTASPLPEQLAGGGIFVAPRDEAGLAIAMRTLLTDEPGRVAMGRRARARAVQLSWPAAARAALAALREAAA